MWRQRLCFTRRLCLGNPPIFVSFLSFYSQYPAPKTNISQVGKRTIVFKHTLGVDMNMLVPRMVTATFVLGPTGPFARSKIVWAMAKLEVKLQKLVSKVDTST